MDGEGGEGDERGEGKTGEIQNEDIKVSPLWICCLTSHEENGAKGTVEGGVEAEVRSRKESTSSLEEWLIESL